MKIKQITETTTSGSIATVNSPLGGTQSRGNPSIYGGKKVGSLFKGKKTSAPYANSINESAELSEAHLEEDDVIVVPGQGRSRKNGLVPHGKSRLDHEVEMARSDLFSAAKNAQQVYSMIKDLSEEEGLEGWVQEKIIKANDYLNTIREYLEGKQVQGVDESIEDNPVANALINYIMKHRPDLLKHGADRVGDAIDRIASRAGNVRNINPDDLNKLIKQVEYYVTSNNNDMYESVTENNQRVDSLVTDALKIMRGSELTDAVKALKTVLGNREYNSRRGFYNFYIKQMIDMYGQQGVAEGSLEELSTGLLQKAAQVAKDKRNKAMDPKIHNALGGGYMNPLAKHYDTVSQKLSNKAAKAGQQDAIEKIASPAVMRKMGMSGKGATEGAKVDRMVKHIEKSEEKSGKSKKEAENIAWATANKRGMLDNKNKKA